MDKKLLDEIVWNEWSKGKTADIKPLGSDFVMDTMPFKGRFRHSVQDERPFTYEAEGKFISLKPTGMWWVVGEEEVSVGSVNSSTGSLVEGKIEYPDALGSGVDIELSMERRKWQKKITIRSLESLGAIPAEAEFLEIGFEVETDFAIEGWDKKSDYMFDKAVKLGEMSRIEPVKVWNSCKEEVTKAFLKAIDGRLYLIKRIPAAYLKDAVYPVYTDITIAYGAEYTVNAVVTAWVHCATLDSTHFLVVYEDAGGDEYGIARIGVVTGDAIAYGAEFPFHEVYTRYISCAVLDSTHFVVAFKDEGGTDQGFARIGVVTGDAIAYGAEYNFNAAITDTIGCAALDSTHFVVVFRDDGGADDCIAMIGVVTGDAIAFGAEYLFNAGTAGCSVAALDSTHFVVVKWASLAYFGVAMIGVVTGDAIAYGAEYTFNAAATYGGSCAGLDSTHFVVAFTDDGGDGYGIAMIGVVTGDAIAFGAEYVFNEALTAWISYGACAALDSTHFVVVFQDDGGDDYGIAMIGTVTGDAIAYSDEYAFNEAITSWMSCAALDSTDFVVVYYDTPDLHERSKIGVVEGLPSAGMRGLNPAMMEVLGY